MLVQVASALMYYAERRRLIDVFPDGIRKSWDEWELRIFILLSLICQLVLISLANRRRYFPKTRIRIILWFAYLAADSVATVALGLISQKMPVDYDHKQQQQQQHKLLYNYSTKYYNAHQTELMSLWAPFLLLHLGGPDTITAYSLEDNELWLRHLLGLVVQAGIALYIFLEALPGSTWLPFLSAFVLGAGLIKYCERTWALRSANREHFCNSMFTSPDPGPNYAKFMGEFTLRKAQGFLVKADKLIEVHDVPTYHSQTGNESKMISEAYNLFQTFRGLFVDLILSFQERERSKYFRQQLSPESAFHLVEVELAFAYDILYTKASISYTPLGCIFRLLSFSSMFGVLVAFIFLADNDSYRKIDLVITYLLLVVAVLLEIYTAINMLFSDYTTRWLCQHYNRHDSFFQRPNKVWWSNSMAQYNLLSVCFHEPTVMYGIQKLFGVHEYVEKHRYKTYNEVSDKLKHLIFDRLKDFAKRSSDNCEDNRNLCTNCSRSLHLLHQHTNPSLKDWSTPKVEFDQKVLLWHIATDLCYFLDFEEIPGEYNIPSNCLASKYLSDYMLYLLVVCPFMLPIGIGMIRFRDTCAEAREFFQEQDSTTKKGKASRRLLQVNTEVEPATVKGDRSKSVLFDACRLAKTLQSMDNWEKWKVVSDAWVGMIAFTATNCRGNHHAQQLRKGGELLTHVWLLMAHLGITEQFQIYQGHARSKLNVS